MRACWRRTALPRPPPPPGDDVPRTGPAVELPRDGRDLADFARECGAITKTNGMFIRDLVPVTIRKVARPREGGFVLTMEPMTSERFRTYMSGLALVHKNKLVGEPDEEGHREKRKVKVTMKKDIASGTLASERLPEAATRADGDQRGAAADRAGGRPHRAFAGGAMTSRRVFSR